MVTIVVRANSQLDYNIHCKWQVSMCFFFGIAASGIRYGRGKKKKPKDGSNTANSTQYEPVCCTPSRSSNYKWSESCFMPLTPSSPAPKSASLHWSAREPDWAVGSELGYIIYYFPFSVILISKNGTLALLRLPKEQSNPRCDCVLPRSVAIWACTTWPTRA